VKEEKTEIDRWKAAENTRRMRLFVGEMDNVEKRYCKKQFEKGVFKLLLGQLQFVLALFQSTLRENFLDHKFLSSVFLFR
jgi:hypothetical protein